MGIVPKEQAVYFAYLVAFGGAVIGETVDVDTGDTEAGNEAPYAAAYALGIADRYAQLRTPRRLRDVVPAVRDMLNPDGAGAGRITKEQAQEAARAALEKVSEFRGSAPEILFENVAYVIETAINGGD